MNAIIFQVSERNIYLWSRIVDVLVFLVGYLQEQGQFWVKLNVLRAEKGGLVLLLEQIPSYGHFEEILLSN